MGTGSVDALGVGALEILAAPALAWRRTRAAAWCLLVAMHLGILLTLDFADLTVGMLMVHLFAFDPRWFWRRDVDVPRSRTAA